MASGGFPTLETYLSFENDGSGNPILVDFTDKCRSFQTRRGRESPLQSVEASTYSAELNNDDRALDPNYEGTLINKSRNPSVETNTTEYVALLSSIVRSNADALFGSWSLKTTTTNAGGSGWTYDNTGFLTIGETYTATVYAKLAAAGSKTFRLRLRWYDGVGALISTETGSSATITDTGWTRLVVTGVCPANTVTVQVEFRTTSAIGVFDVYSDGLQIEENTSATEYCDGDEANCAWVGTAHASESIRGGQHFGLIRPMNRLFQRAVWSAVTYDVANVWIERYVQQWRLKANEATVAIDAADLLKMMNLRLLGGGTIRPEELVSDRVTAMADLFVFLNNNTDISATMTMMPAKDVGHRSVLSVLKECQVTEDGRMFVGADGHFVFRNRQEDWTRTESKTSQATFGDDLDNGELPYFGLELALDDDDLYNDVRVTREGGVEQAVNDATSIATYEQRTLSISTFSDSDVDSMAMATFKLSQRKDPHVRVKSMTLRPGRDDLLWPQVLGRNLGDRVTVNRRPPGEAGVISGEYWIEGISHNVNATQRFWETTWNLWPATDRTFWILGDAVLSELGVTTIPQY